MKRSIPDEEFLKIINSNPLALNTDILIKNKRILNDFKHWVIIENKYPYVEYNGFNVIKHLLIVPKNDAIDTFFKLNIDELSELQKVIKYLTQEHTDESNNMIVYMWKEKGKSINKFHIHFLFLEG